MIVWSKPIPKPPENPSDHFEPVSASLDHSQPILHRFYIFEILSEKKMCLKYFWSISYIFFISWALEALGPLPNCRSHFSDQDGINESSRNLQNTSFMIKQCSKMFHEVFLKYFLFFLLFPEPWRLWDHSQIVDLIFLIWMVSTRASESSKTPHSWQNNVPKRSTKYF